MVIYSPLTNDATKSRIHIKHDDLCKEIEIDLVEKRQLVKLSAHKLSYEKQFPQAKPCEEEG